MNITLLILFSLIFDANIALFIRCLFQTITYMDKFNSILLLISSVNLFFGLTTLFLSQLLICVYIFSYYFDDIKKYYEMIVEMNQMMNSMMTNLSNLTDEEKNKLNTNNNLLKKIDSLLYYVKYGINTIITYRDWIYDNTYQLQQKYNYVITTIFNYIKSCDNIIINILKCIIFSFYKIDYIHNTVNEYGKYFEFFMDIKNNNKTQIHNKNTINNDLMQNLGLNNDMHKINNELNNEIQTMPNIDDMANMINMLKAMESMTQNISEPKNIKINTKTTSGQKMSARQLRRKKY